MTFVPEGQAEKSGESKPMIQPLTTFLPPAQIGSIVPLGRGYFPPDSRHFVPGYYRAVPPGQKPFAHRAAERRTPNGER
jgi:hypothetical protein